MRSMRNRDRIAMIFATSASALFLISIVSPVVSPYAPSEGIHGMVIYGTVTAYGSGLPISGAEVECYGVGTTTTNANGNYYFVINKGGSYLVKVRCLDYETQSKWTSISWQTGLCVADFVMVPARGVHGFVYDENGAPIEDATVTCSPGGYTTMTYSNGYYWFNPLRPGDYSVTAKKFGYWTSRWDKVTMSLYDIGVVWKNFTCAHDMIGAVPLAAMFASVNPAHTKVTLEYTIGDATKTSVSFNIAGSGISKTTTTPWTMIFVSSNHPFMIIGQQCWVTGTYSMTTSLIVSMQVRNWINVYTCDSTTNDYWGKYSINVSKVSSKKGWIKQVSPAVPYKATVNATGSVIYQHGISLSVCAYGVPVTAKCVGFAADKVKSSLSITIVNNDTVTHEYKFYLEGTDPYGGMVFHVWEM